MRVTTDAREDSTDIEHERLYHELVVKEAGYVYVYLSNENETPVDVFFDDFTVEHVQSPVIQINGYYPFGMTAYTWLRENEEFTNYLFQGKEYDSITNWHDFHARQYDAALGRWFAVDPAGQFNNPYMALLNNPFIYTDPDGRIIPLLVVIGAAVVGGGLNLWQNWDNVKGDPLRALGYFASGAASGALSTTGPLGWAAGGLITGASNAAMGGGDGRAITQGAIVGAFSGLVGGYAGQLGGKFGNVVINGLRINSPFLSGAITGALGGALGGFAGGATGGALMGYNVWQSAINGALTGAVVGASVGSGWAGINSYRDGMNPFTGKSLKPGSTGVVGQRSIENQGFTKPDKAFDTPHGKRHLDGISADKSTGVEAKTGKVGDTKFIRSQLRKDFYLLDEGAIRTLEWRFYKSPVTNQQGYSLAFSNRLSLFATKYNASTATYTDITGGQVIRIWINK